VGYFKRLVVAVETIAENLTEIRTAQKLALSQNSEQDPGQRAEEAVRMATQIVEVIKVNKSDVKQKVLKGD
jgi:hypothetical protein